MTKPHRTIFYQQHKDLGAKIVEFAGWQMPIQYADGILSEHMKTREKAGLFDVSHMGRLLIHGSDALPFLQHVLTNNAADLAVLESQYTLIQNKIGCAIDDAYLYRFHEDEYLLVVNASNREKDLIHLQTIIKQFPNAMLIDKTFETAMVSLQGPLSSSILEQCINKGELPEPVRNNLSIVEIANSEILLARTGYTGEPSCFELFMKQQDACQIWDLLLKKGASPIGLGARDTLRLEAGLPLYGHELGLDHDGTEIPIFASKLSKFAVSFSKLKGDFIAKDALHFQKHTLQRIMADDLTTISLLPRRIVLLAITGKGIAREGYQVFCKNKEVGYITSGTMVPYRLSSERQNIDDIPTDPIKKRAIALALLDVAIKTGDILEITIRNKRCEAVLVPYHINSSTPPHVQIILHTTHFLNDCR